MKKVYVNDGDAIQTGRSLRSFELDPAKEEEELCKYGSFRYPYSPGSKTPASKISEKKKWAGDQLPIKADWCGLIIRGDEAPLIKSSLCAKNALPYLVARFFVLNYFCLFLEIDSAAICIHFTSCT